VILFNIRNSLVIVLVICILLSSSKILSTVYACKGAIIALSRDALQPGPRGPPGPPGLTKNLVSEIITVSKKTFFDPDSGKTPFTDITASCPEGKIITGGGYEIRPVADIDIRVYYNGPNSPSSWLVKVANLSGPEETVKVFAICVGLE